MAALAVALSLLCECAHHVGVALELGVLADALLLHLGHGPLAHTNGHQLHAVRHDGEADEAVLVLGAVLGLGVLAGQLGAVGRERGKGGTIREAKKRGEEECGYMRCVGAGGS
jgi:hypothetical protein